MGSVSRALFRPRPIGLLLLISVAIGVIHGLLMLPLGVIAGNAAFWQFPRGTVPGSASDMAQVMVGYSYFVRSPWLMPLLLAPHLGAPDGTNIFWLDAVPLVTLIGKLVFTATGVFVNVLGAYLFCCFVLPGVGMTLLLWIAGQSCLLAVIVGAVLIDAMPYLMFEWGHVALNSQYILVFALALYLASQRWPRQPWVVAGWLALLAGALLINTYLFVMAGACWTAGLLQRVLDRRAPLPRLAAEAVAVITPAVALLLVTGILSRNLASAGTMGFGVFSMNLGGPFIPQWSGVIPPMARYWLGMRTQVFDYMGLGALLVIAAALPALLRAAGRNAGSHVVLICLLFGCTLFALSNEVRLGSHLLLRIPLPERIIYALGTFRASGRFFWPAGFALTAAGLVLVLRTYRPRSALALLVVAALLQLVDAQPIRAAIAESAGHPAPAAVDRPRLAALVHRADAVLVFPSFGCVADRLSPDDVSAIQRLYQENMEIQLAAASDNLPINSVDNARINPDCAAETKLLRQPLQPGTAYFYLTPFAPDTKPLNGKDPADNCTRLGDILACLIPKDAGSKQ